MSKHYIMITETCECGGKFDVEGIDPVVMDKMIEKWRERHVHKSVQFTYPQNTATWQSTSRPRSADC